MYTVVTVYILFSDEVAGKQILIYCESLHALTLFIIFANYSDKSLVLKIMLSVGNFHQYLSQQFRWKSNKIISDINKLILNSHQTVLRIEHCLITLKMQNIDQMMGYATIYFILYGQFVIPPTI